MKQLAINSRGGGGRYTKLPHNPRRKEDAVYRG